MSFDTRTDNETDDWAIRRTVFGDDHAAHSASGNSTSHSTTGGLDTRDLLVATLGALLIVAFGPFFWASTWTPRACLVLAALPFGLFELSRLARRADRAAIVASIVVAWAILTSLLSAAPWVSLLPGLGRHEGAWLMAAAAGCWALGRALTAPGRRVLVIGFLAASALNGVVALVQVVGGINGGPLGMLDGRALGLSINPVYFGAVTAGAVASCMWFVSTKARSRRTDQALVGVVVGVALVTISGSRVALASVVVVAIAMISVHRTRGSLAAFAAGVAGMVFGTLLHRAAGGGGVSATERVGNGGLGTRLQVWRYGWQAFLDQPLTGYGLGRYRPAIQTFFDADFVTNFQRDDLGESWFESHNIIVQMTVGMGVVGIALLATFLVLVLRNARGPLVWAAGAIAFTWLLQPARLVTFPLVALLLGASQPLIRDAVVDGRRRMAPWLAGAAATASMALAGWAIGADLQMRAAASNPSLAASTRAVRWSPWDARVAFEAATVIYDPSKVTDPDVAEHVLRWNTRATELEPDFPYWWTRLGIRQMALADDAIARVSFERAIGLQPYHPVSLKMLSIIAAEQDDDELLSLVNGRLAELGFKVEAVEESGGS